MSQKAADRKNALIKYVLNLISNNFRVMWGYKHEPFVIV